MVVIHIYEFLLVMFFFLILQSLLKSCTVKMILSIVQVRKLNLKG